MLGLTKNFNRSDEKWNLSESLPRCAAKHEVKNSSAVIKSLKQKLWLCGTCKARYVWMSTGEVVRLPLGF